MLPLISVKIFSDISTPRVDETATPDIFRLYFLSLTLVNVPLVPFVNVMLLAVKLPNLLFEIKVYVPFTSDEALLADIRSAFIFCFISVSVRALLYILAE